MKSIEDILEGIHKGLESRHNAASQHHIKVKDLQPGDTFLFAIDGNLAYGRVLPGPDDHDLGRSARENGYITSRCYSKDIPQGWLMDVHVTFITHKISPKVLSLAKANGFRHTMQMN